MRLAHAALLLIALAGSAPLGTTAPADTPEDAVKAALTLNFVRFTDWPAANPQSPLIVGVLGRTEIVPALRQLAERKPSGRSLTIRHLRTPAEAQSCHVLYFADVPKKLLQETLDTLRGHPVLTIGESNDTLAAGGIIQLLELDGRIGFEVNVEAMRRSQIQISAKLLKLATAIRGKLR